MLVIGLGNRFRRDDGAGLEVVRRIREHGPADLSAIEWESTADGLLELWIGQETVVVVDAMHSTAEPGTVRRFDVSTGPLPSAVLRVSSHSVGLGEAVELARRLGRLPAKLIVYGIEGADFSHGEGISPGLEAAVESVAERVKDETAPYRNTLREETLETSDYDWSRFEIVFYYDAPRTDVFRAWATASGLESFFIDCAVFRDATGQKRSSDSAAQSGDAYCWQWRQRHSVEGRVIEMVENERFTFTFGMMQVALSFTTFEGQTELRLTQTGIPESAEGRVMGHLNCRSCWVFFLTNLTSVLANGSDLRDSGADRVSSMEVGFAALSTRPQREGGDCE